jgi:hypothetical protein
MGAIYRVSIRSYTRSVSGAISCHYRSSYIMSVSGARIRLEYRSWYFESWYCIRIRTGSAIDTARRINSSSIYTKTTYRRWWINIQHLYNATYFHMVDRYSTAESAAAASVYETAYGTRWINISIAVFFLYRSMMCTANICTESGGFIQAKHLYTIWRIHSEQNRTEQCWRRI